MLDDNDYSINDHAFINQLGINEWDEWQDITIDDCAIGFILVNAVLTKPLGVFRDGQTVTAMVDFHAMTVSVKDDEREDKWALSVTLDLRETNWHQEPNWAHHKPEIAKKPMNPVKSKWGW